MIEATIRWSINHRVFVLLATAILVGSGLFALRNTPIDAIPDLSDVQVIIKTNYPGQAPQVVEDQVTYPLTTAMLSVPGAVKVRGFSFFGDSYVYVIFDEDTDLYWARSRVLEYLSQVAPSLPAAARPRRERYGGVIRVSGAREVEETWQNQAAGYPLTTGAVRDPDGSLWITSLSADWLGRLPAP